MPREGPRRALFHDGAGHKTYAPRLAFWLGTLTALIALMVLVEITKLKIRRGQRLNTRLQTKDGAWLGFKNNAWRRQTPLLALLASALFLAACSDEAAPPSGTAADAAAPVADTVYVTMSNFCVAACNLINSSISLLGSMMLNFLNHSLIFF